MRPKMNTGPKEPLAGDSDADAYYLSSSFLKRVF